MTDCRLRIAQAAACAATLLAYHIADKISAGLEAAKLGLLP